MSHMMMCAIAWGACMCVQRMAAMGTRATSREHPLTYTCIHTHTTDRGRRHEDVSRRQVTVNNALRGQALCTCGQRVRLSDQVIKNFIPGVT